jgi:transposase-like protein
VYIPWVGIRLGFATAENDAADDEVQALVGGDFHRLVTECQLAAKELVACCGGLKNLPESITNILPLGEVQLRVVHMVRTRFRD